jgi:hypothetical protein
MRQPGIPRLFAAGLLLLGSCGRLGYDPQFAPAMDPSGDAEAGRLDAAAPATDGEALPPADGPRSDAVATDGAAAVDAPRAVDAAVDGATADGGPTRLDAAAGPDAARAPGADALSPDASPSAHDVSPSGPDASPSGLAIPASARPTVQTRTLATGAVSLLRLMALDPGAAASWVRMDGRRLLTRLDGLGQLAGTDDLGPEAEFEQATVAPAPQGGFLTVFSNHPWQGRWVVFGQLQGGMAFPVSDGVFEGKGPVVAPADGGFAVAYRQGGGLGFARVSPTGNILSRVTPAIGYVNPTPTRLAPAAGGFFVLARSSSSSNAHVLARFDGAGGYLGAEPGPRATDTDLAVAGGRSFLTYARDRELSVQEISGAGALVGPAVRLHTAAHPVTELAATALTAGLAVAWVEESAGRGRVSFAVTDLAGGVRPVVTLSEDGVDARAVGVVWTGSRFLVTWREPASNVLQVAALVY